MLTASKVAMGTSANLTAQIAAMILYSNPDLGSSMASRFWSVAFAGAFCLECGLLAGCKLCAGCDLAFTIASYTMTKPLKIPCVPRCDWEAECLVLYQPQYSRAGIKKQLNEQKVCMIVRRLVIHCTLLTEALYLSEYVWAVWSCFPA